MLRDSRNSLKRAPDRMCSSDLIRLCNLQTGHIFIDSPGCTFPAHTLFDSLGMVQGLLPRVPCFPVLFDLMMAFRSTETHDITLKKNEPSIASNLISYQ